MGTKPVLGVAGVCGLALVLTGCTDRYAHKDTGKTKFRPETTWASKERKDAAAVAANTAGKGGAAQPIESVQPVNNLLKTPPPPPPPGGLDGAAAAAVPVGKASGTVHDVTARPKEIQQVGAWKEQPLNHKANGDAIRSEDTGAKAPAADPRVREVLPPPPPPTGGGALELKSVSQRPETPDAPQVPPPPPPAPVGIGSVPPPPPPPSPADLKSVLPPQGYRDP